MAKLAFILDDITLLFEATHGIDPLSEATGQVTAEGGRTILVDISSGKPSFVYGDGLPGITSVTVDEYTFHFCKRATQLSLPSSTGYKTLNMAELPRPKTIRVAANGLHRIDSESLRLRSADAGIHADVDATSLFRKFERTIQEAESASVIYETEITTTRVGNATVERHWGAYQTVKGGKRAHRHPDGTRGFQAGAKVTNMGTFYDPSPYDFLINQLTRSGFGENPNDIVAYMAMWPIEEMQLVEDAQMADCTCLEYTVHRKEGQSRIARLWIDTTSLAPRKRELRYRKEDGTRVHVTEHYLGFNTEPIPEPFGESQLASKLVAPPPSRGRLSVERNGEWKETVWLASGRLYRAEEVTEFRDDVHGCVVVVNPGCEFELGEASEATLRVLKGVMSVGYDNNPHFGLNVAGIDFKDNTEGRSRLIVSADRVYVEQGSARASGGTLEKDYVLREGVEYAVRDGKIEEQSERTLHSSESTGEAH